MGLRKASNPFEIMDVAIAANTFREYLFDPETLNKPFAWEIALKNLPSNIGNLISGTCDWGGLGDCMFPVIAEFTVTAAVKKATGYSAAGKTACAAFAIEPTKISCIPCVGYIAVEALTNAKTINNTIGCIKTNCFN